MRWIATIRGGVTVRAQLHDIVFNFWRTLYIKAICHIISSMKLLPFPAISPSQNTIFKFISLSFIVISHQLYGVQYVPGFIGDVLCMLQMFHPFEDGHPTVMNSLNSCSLTGHTQRQLFTLHYVIISAVILTIISVQSCKKYLVLYIFEFGTGVNDTFKIVCLF